MEELFTIHGSVPVFLRRDALDLGYRDRDLREGLRSGLLQRVRHGAYVPAATWNDADSEQRHRLHAQAVLLSHDSPLALSHVTAAAHHGLRMYEPDLRRVHVVALGPAPARSCSDIVYHRIDRDFDQDLIEIDGVPVVPAPEAALQAASLTDVAHGLVILDSALHLKLASLDDLHRHFERHTGSPATQRLRLTLRLTKYGSESAGESLGRHLMWSHHLPEPTLQYEVFDATGTLIGTADWGWPDYGLLGEFDGKTKYGDLVPNGMTPSDVLVREKLREDRMREATGWPMLRLVWRDLYTPDRTVQRIQDALARGRRLVG